MGQQAAQGDRLYKLCPLIFAPSTLTGNIQIIRVNGAELMACPKNQHRDF
jgi:hypothetical protein